MIIINILVIILIKCSSNCSSTGNLSDIARAASACTAAQQ